jgi:hypothetical protein
MEEWIQTGYGRGSGLVHRRDKTDRGTDFGVYRWASKSFSLWLHTTVVQAEIYSIKVCAMGNTEKGYTGRNICILSDS